ncbi:hypothetical protein JAAARDRAFT_194326 [Jaapia argillacea MUCL 33604]|uniref:F-box domain-containing protein n=1 Tax=Jaapia argillacea MUCL 33604 TaxID=933084 RepID=A0A067Q3I1_9AGAM|nr:hypothetical protein JAAARDRAFT_194326 [Jaapia argillacea MUCL 33604]
MYALPVELLHHIIALSNPSAQAVLRVTSKGLHNLVTPLLFPIIRLRDTVKCAESLKAVSENQAVSRYVEQVWLEVIDYVDKWKPERQMRQLENLRAIYEAINVLRSAFEHLNSFTSLHTIRLKFISHFLEEDAMEAPEQPSPDLQLQWDLLTTITAHRPPSLHTLVLENLTAMFNDEVYDSADVKSLLASLKHLRFGVVSGMEVEGYYLQDRLRDFWNVTVPQQLLSPAQANLTSLAITSDQAVGPEITFSPLFFPNLTSLSLHKVLFGWQTETTEFLFKHKGTLRELCLDSCPILLPDGFDPVYTFSYWSDILRCIASECLHLTSFSLFHTYGWGTSENEDLRMVYVWFEWDDGYVLCNDILKGALEDEKALEELVATIDTRRNTSLRP